MCPEWQKPEKLGMNGSPVKARTDSERNAVNIRWNYNEVVTTRTKN